MLTARYVALAPRFSCGVVSAVDGDLTLQDVRDITRAFVEAEVAPHLQAWEQAREPVPLEVIKKAGDAGLLAIGFPAPYGLCADSTMHQVVLHEELCRLGSGGLPAALFSHSIGMMPVATFGTPAQCERWLPSVLAGDKIAALGVTEPSGGSDVASLKTTARREGDTYVVNGEKTFITGGMRADFVTCAVRTGGPGPQGVSMLVVETDTPGFSRTPLSKMGWHCSDTAALHFDDVVVPAGNLIGEENRGFHGWRPRWAAAFWCVLTPYKGIMHNFNNERLIIATHAIALARACYEEALEWARMRQTFGAPLVSRQAIRHKLVDMLTDIEAAASWRDRTVLSMDGGGSPVAHISMLKNFSTTMVERVSSAAIQVLGGAGYLEGTVSERVFRETKVLQIGGGSTEVMKDLAARQLGLDG